jgi:hypothetical protein
MRPQVARGWSSATSSRSRRARQAGRGGGGGGGGGAPGPRQLRGRPEGGGVRQDVGRRVQGCGSMRRPGHGVVPSSSPCHFAAPAAHRRCWRPTRPTPAPPAARPRCPRRHRRRRRRRRHAARPTRRRCSPPGPRCRPPRLLGCRPSPRCCRCRCCCRSGRSARIAGCPQTSAAAAPGAAVLGSGPQPAARRGRCAARQGQPPRRRRWRPTRAPPPSARSRARARAAAAARRTRPRRPVAPVLPPHCRLRPPWRAIGRVATARGAVPGLGGRGARRRSAQRAGPPVGHRASRAGHGAALLRARALAAGRGPGIAGSNRGAISRWRERGEG